MKKHDIGTLYEELHAYLITLIRNRLFEGCPDDYAYDCLNDVFMIAIHKQDDPKFQSNPKAWLIKTAQHVVDNFNRKNGIRLRHHITSYDVDLSQIPCKKNMVEDLAFKMAIEDHILDKIKKDLTPEERVLFIMRFEELKDVAEIANELYMRKATVSTRITRLKKRVTQLVQYYTGE